MIKNVINMINNIIIMWWYDIIKWVMSDGINNYNAQILRSGLDKENLLKKI